MDTVFSLLIAAGCSAVSSERILQVSSCKRPCIKASEKTIFMQTILIIKEASTSVLFVLCKKSVNTYRQSYADLFLMFKIILTPPSPKPVCVLGRYYYSLLLSTNKPTYHLQSFGRPLSSSNHFLVKNSDSGFP